MSFDWNHMQATSASRRHKLEQEAEQSRIAYVAASNRKRTVRIMGPVMFRIGGLFMTWGRQLQNQYGEISTSIQEIRE